MYDDWCMGWWTHMLSYRLALHAQNNYSVMYDLGIAICSLAQTDLLSGWQNDKPEVVPQLRPCMQESSGKLNQGTCKARNIVICEFVTVHSYVGQHPWSLSCGKFGLVMGYIQGQMCAVDHLTLISYWRIQMSHSFLVCYNLYVGACV